VVKKRIIKILSFFLILPFLSACGTKQVEDDASKTESEKKIYNIAMVSDTGGITDKSFNQSAYEGLKSFEKEKSDTVKINHVESKQASDYVTNLDKMADTNNNLIFAIGHTMAPAVLEASSSNPDISYAIVDISYGENTPENVTGITFRSQESAFLVGYIAGKVTKSNKVGFVGGMKGVSVDPFEYGYRAGVCYAEKELDKKIEVTGQYAETFGDAALGKAIASKMFSANCDIIFQAAGGTGIGVIEAAKESGKFAIGVDMDQSSIAPKNILTSALKDVGRAVKKICQIFTDGKKIGGQTFTYGLTEECVGIPVNNPNLPQEVYNSAMEVSKKIVKKEITPPENEEKYLDYIKKLK